MLDGIEVSVGTDFFDDREGWKNRCKKIVFTGRIDEYFDFCFGDLEYRTLRFEHEVADTSNYQGCAVVNYSSSAVPWTRIIEHIHFNPRSVNRSIITKEIPTAWDRACQASDVASCQNGCH